MRYLLTVFLILVSVICHAQGMLPVGSCVNNHVAACAPASDYVGNKSSYTTDINTGTDDANCQGPFTPTCSGTLEYAYILHTAAAADVAKVCVYLDDGDDVADDGDSLVGCSNPIAGDVGDDDTNGTWKSSSSKVTGSVSTGSKYWVCVAGTTENWTGGLQSTGTSKRYTYTDTWNSYASPPAYLPASASSSDTSSEMSIYVRIE